MLVYLQIVLNVIYYLIGKDTYKYLKSYPNLIEDLTMVSNTLSKLIKMKNDDTIIKGHHTHNEYKFFKSHLFDIISAKYVILNDGFKKQAIHNAKARIVDFDTDIDFIGGFIKPKFELSTVLKFVEVVEVENPKKGEDKTKVVPRPWGKAVEEYWSENHSNDDVLTPQQWNNFWEEIITVSHKDKQLENLECRAITLSQIPGVLVNKQNYRNDDLLAFMHLDGDLLQVGEVMDEHLDNPYLYDFKNETEYPLEFAIVKGSGKRQDAFVAYLSPNKLECSKDLVSNMFDIHSYLFSDI